MTEYQPIENYGVIGDLHTVALAGMDGSIDFMCFPIEKMLGYANHLGLYSEELGPRGEHLGNYPQAFTHLGLISAAYNLDRNLSREGR